jgi:diketogulonate reductase-like aldo/keto reductase
MPMLDPPHIETCGIPVTAMPKCKAESWSWKACRRDSWRAMSELQKEGKLRALGTSNFELRQLRELVEVGTPPAVNQLEYHVGVS